MHEGRDIDCECVETAMNSPEAGVGQGGKEAEGRSIESFSEASDKITIRNKEKAPPDLMSSEAEPLQIEESLQSLPSGGFWFYWS